MLVEQFSVTIPEGTEFESGHVRLAHGQTYSVRLANRRTDMDADAKVEIDGVDQGEYRVEAGRALDLERSFRDAGKFTFYLTESAEGRQAGVQDRPAEERGLVRVTFRPGRRRHVKALSQSARYEEYLKGSQGRHFLGATKGVPQNMAVPISADGGAHFGIANFSEERTAAPAGLEQGGTGLSGHSHQRFHEAPPIDYEGPEVVITLRLAGAPAVRPLSGPKANPVPAPVP